MLTHDVEYLPLTGSPGGLADLSATAARAAGALAETSSGLARVARHLEGHVSGAVDGARRLLAELRAETELCADVLAETSRALAERSACLAGEQQDAHRAILARDEAHVRVARAADDEADARRVALDPFDPRHPSWSQLAWQARLAGATARSDVTAAESRWRAARDAKVTGSRSTAPRLAGLAHVRAVRLATSAGTTPPAFTTSWRSGVDLSGLVRAVAPGLDREARSAARDELLAAVVAAGDDPVLWTAFWESTTPAELYAAIGVTPVDDDAALALADGLAAWAESATPSALRDLGHSLVDDLPGSFVELGDRAGLAATLLAPMLPAGVHVGAADALVERRQRQGDDADLLATGAVSVAVADGLAARPQAALDHLAPSDEEIPAMVDHWFGTAPTDGWPDGGAAVTGLLAAAVAAGTGSDDVDQQSRSALLVSTATRELVTDHGLLAGPYPVSDEAGRNVADAYAPYLVSAGDTVHQQLHDMPQPEPGVAGRPQLAEGTGVYAPVVQPLLDAFAFRDVVAATSSTETASGHWVERVDRYLDDAVAEVVAPGRGLADAEALTAGATRDAAAVLGSITSGTIVAARADQEATARTAGWFSSGLSLATTRSPSGASLAATGVSTLLPPLLPDGVEAARGEVLRTEPELRAWVTGRFGEAVRDQLAAQGFSAEEVDRATERLDPDSKTLRDTFGNTFAINADLRRELGDLT
ncbi:hypothetical protein GCM10009718_14550 [Isoptericola halotolerans]|uniref:Uncharacterized protein n=1 Tax=Isoptericola halotolerans TaxID=300560 RepID=A0ABX2A1Z3_9MICO|nr:hypothetical protein [Isoptericola halotolerans]NOV95623.1 hypothetical protein [Isoptericola halotolerans]